MAWSSTSRMRMTSFEPFTDPSPDATANGGNRPSRWYGFRGRFDGFHPAPGRALSLASAADDGGAAWTAGRRAAAPGRRRPVGPARAAARSRFCARGPCALESHGFLRADVAQLAEHITRNDGVLGSIPSVGSNYHLHRPPIQGGLSPDATGVCRVVCCQSSRHRAGVSCCRAGTLHGPGGHA